MAFLSDLRRSFRSLLKARGFVTLGIVTSMLAAVGVAACLLPAMRAAKVDPAIASRSE